MTSHQTETGSKGMAWWLYICFAIFTYLGLKYGFPLLCDAFGDPHVGGLGGQIAPILTIVFLLLGANALYKGTSEQESCDEEPEGDDPATH